MQDKEQRELEEKLSPEQRALLLQLRAEIAETDRVLAKVDRDLFWYGMRQVAEIVLYIVCCLFAYWAMFG